MLTPHALLKAIIKDGHWDIEYASEYAEPVYDIETGETHDCQGILIADWNNETRRGTEEECNRREYWPVVSTFRSRVADILARAGFDIEWSDEWSTCECGKAVRTQPDSYGWTPSFMIVAGEFWCRECWRDCMSVGDRMQPCVDAGFSMFAARRNTIPCRS